MSRIVMAFILWTLRKAGKYGWQQVVTFDDAPLFRRFAPFWPDEFVRRGEHHHRPPWWRPFNMLLHWWMPGRRPESFHDHPRWSVTICLRGKLVEMTPWGDRLLKPGAVVFRTRKAIHAFRVPDGYTGTAWTLFVVGRRNWPQNTYQITPRGRE